MTFHVFYIDTFSKPSNCSYNYNDNEICSQCADMKYNAQQQIVLLPMRYSEIVTNGITISDPRDLNMKTCSYIDNENYFALTILVTESEKLTLYPIAMEFVSSIITRTVGKIPKACNLGLLITNDS